MTRAVRDSKKGEKEKERNTLSFHVCLTPLSKEWAHVRSVLHDFLSAHNLPYPAAAMSSTVCKACREHVLTPTTYVCTF